MKRFISAVLALMLAITCAACNSEQAADPTVSAYVPGVQQDDTYTSAYLRIGVKLPSVYTYYTADQLQDVNGFPLDVNDAAFKDGVAQSQLLCEMYAAGPNGNSVDIQLENLTLANVDATDAAAYAALAINELKGSLESMGYEDVTATQTEISFAGGTHTAMHATGRIGQFTLYQTVVCIKVDNYVARITAGSFTDTTVTELLAMFYAV